MQPLVHDLLLIKHNIFQLDSNKMNNKQIVRISTPAETQIYITPQAPQVLTTDNLEELSTENDEDKFDKFKRRLIEEKPPNSGHFGPFISLGTILCGKCKKYLNSNFILSKKLLIIQVVSTRAHSLE